jgi:1-acyl-sn-glycerol-3-phosphate acyltransferase
VFAKQELFAIPGWGYSARTYGLIPVARDKGAKTLRAMLALAKQRVDEGRPLVIFPEGTRVAHGTRPPLQAGFAGLYKLLRLPVVPIAVDSGAAYHHLVKQPGRITYKVGDMIPAGLPREEVEARVHAAINALNG